MDGNDFAMIVERELFESTWEHLVPRLLAPIEEVLANVGVEKTDIDSVEIIGGLIRIPKV
jgi:molecular chaperone DnaK (HSP70)